MQSRSLAILTHTILPILSTIFSFNQQIDSSGLCTVTDVQNQLSQLTSLVEPMRELPAEQEAFAHARLEVEELLSAPDINTSSADHASQILRRFHGQVALQVQSDKSDAFRLYVATINLRVSLANLHVSDAENDLFIADTAGAAKSELSEMLSALDTGKDSPMSERLHFVELWRSHLKKCQDDVEGVARAAGIVTSSPTRFATIAQNMEDIVKSLLVIEDKKFPLSLAAYNRLSPRLENLCQYCRAGGKKQRRDSHAAAEIGGLELGFSVAAPGASARTDYEAFADGFIRADPHVLQAQIVDHIARSNLPKDSTVYRVVSALGSLFNAHAAAFTRNYNIRSTSTRVCYELITEFCSSIVEATVAGRSALLDTQGDGSTLRAVVDRHVAAIHGIQETYTDKPIYSQFGRSRLELFAQFCCILAHATILNISELATQDKAFDFEPMQACVTSAVDTLTQLGDAYRSRVFERFEETKQAALSMLFDEQADHVIVFLVIEEKFCEALSELVEKLMMAVDLRFWKVDRALELTTPEIPEYSGKGVSATHAKNDFEILVETLNQFHTALVTGNIDEFTLATEMGTFDKANAKICARALAIDADIGFKQLVRTFRTRAVTLVNFLRVELTVGTYVLCSKEAAELLQELRLSGADIIRQLGVLEQIEDGTADIPSILLRLVKLLYLARDDLIVFAGKQGGEALVKMATLIGQGYDSVATVLLTVRNAPPSLIRLLRNEKIALLRKILYASLAVLNLSYRVEATLVSAHSEPIESPEFLFTANFEPIAAVLRSVKKAIPEIIPNAATLNYSMSTILLQLMILSEPRYEERPLFSVPV
jgi:hypothetical protein